MTQSSSTKPYLIRALYEWCVDNALTPYILVRVDKDTSVPVEYVRDGEIVLNIGPLASNKLQIGNDRLDCAARFGGVARQISVPIAAIAQIFAKENGQGLNFTVEANSEELGAKPVGPEPGPHAPSGRPILKRVK